MSLTTGQLERFATLREWYRQTVPESQRAFILTPESRAPLEEKLKLLEETFTQYGK